MHDSIIHMTLVDLLIVGVFACAFKVLHRHWSDVQARESKIDFIMIGLGMAAIGAFYIVDLFNIHVAPAIMSLERASHLMDGLHNWFEWYMAPAGFIAMVVGFSRCVLHTTRMHQRLLVNESHLKEAVENAQATLEKLNDSEIELQDQNARLKLALENMSQGLCVFDAQQRLVVSNDKYASLYGLSKDMVRPGTLFRDILQYRIDNSIIMGDDPQKYIQERLASVATSTDTTTIQRLTDGRVIIIAHRPITDGGWVATHEDITDLAKSEAMNQRLARIVENSINEIYVFDSETLQFIQVNKAACENLGYTLEELRELPAYALKPDYDRAGFEEIVEPLRSGSARHVRFESVHRRKDGTEYDINVTLQLIDSQNEKVFAGIVEDVTEHKRAERDLKRSQELFSKAFHANPVPLSISGPGGAIFDVNEAWVNSLGYTREEAIGNSSVKLGIWTDPDVRAHFVDVLKETGSVEKYETQYVTRNGDIRDMIVSGEWLTVRGEERMFVISHDVTERKETERRLLEDRDTLQDLVNQATAGLSAKARELEAALSREKEVNEFQRQFVSMASHEFRTPLAIIDSTAQRLKKNLGRDSTDRTSQRVEKIRGAVERMTRLMESTLTAAKLDEGKIAVEMKPCNIGAIVKDVCARYRDIVASHKITVELKDIPDMVTADAGAIDQILTNLLSNAVKYSPNAPDIAVTAFGDGSDVVLQVRDNGLGIDEDELPNMFSRFFRARTSLGIAGTGIGLNLVKNLVALHEGQISVKSRLNEGSTFTVRLPIQGPRRDAEVA